jgi:hypothetical protein
MKKSITLVTAILVCVEILFATNYYVDSVNGSDTNPGKSPDSAWKTVEKVNRFTFQPGDVIHFQAGQVWRESLRCQSGAENQPVTYTRYGSGAKPLFLASIDLSLEYFWLDQGKNIWSVTTGSFYTGSMPVFFRDIGNIILIRKGETEKKAAWKRWSVEELSSQSDFYHDVNNDMLYFYSEKNPALVYSQMEAAMNRNIFDISRCEYLIIDGLAAAYTGAHGAAGSNTSHVIIRNCDFLWIGGSLLWTRNGIPTRYGNGVEFWNGARDNLVENNYFEQIYDVAMTNQGDEASLVKNIFWRKNKVYRCEQAHEIWLTDSDSQMQNVVFEYNECIDSGFGWSHEQRPDKKGTHILAYAMLAKEFDVHYRKNIFNNAKDAMIWYHNPRLPEARLDNNTYIQKGNGCDKSPLFRWGNNNVTWEEYRQITGNDTNSTFTCE